MQLPPPVNEVTGKEELVKAVKGDAFIFEVNQWIKTKPLRVCMSVSIVI